LRSPWGAEGGKFPVKGGENLAEIGHAPPVSNRGVQNTSRSALRACVDWVQVTFKSVHDLQAIYEILGMREGDFEDCPTGIYGYKCQRRAGHISILYDGGPDMGIHVQMTGQGCREFETYGKKDWRQFFMDCLANDGVFTRLDGAIDDIATTGQQPYFTLNMLYRKVREGAVRSRFKRGKFVQSLLLEDGTSLGETLYFGRESSDIQIRFYEKDFERMDAGKQLEADIVAWNRAEIQCRRDRAQALALYLVNNEDIGRVLAGALRNYIVFCVKQRDTNKARWPVCKWWEDFLGDAEKLKLTMIAPDRTVEKVMRWIEKSVAPSLGLVFAANNGDMDLIMRYVAEGTERMTRQQEEMARKYIEEKEREKREREYLRRRRLNDYEFQKGVHRQKNVTLGERNESEERPVQLNYTTLEEQIIC